MTAVRKHASPYKHVTFTLVQFLMFAPEAPGTSFMPALQPLLYTVFMCYLYCVGSATTLP